MNFIYTLVFWTILFLTTFFFQPMHKDWISTLTAAKVILGIIFIVFLAVMFFYQLDWQNAIRKRINKLKYKRKILQIAKDKYEELKPMYTKYLINEYPKLEKEIINKIIEAQPKDLIAMLQSYPELQSSAAIDKYVATIKSHVDSITSRRYEIEEAINDIENIQDNNWFFCPSKYKNLEEITA